MIAYVNLAVVIVATIIALWQVRMLRIQISSQYDWNKRMKSLSYSLIDNQQLREARIKLDCAFGIIMSKKEAITLSEIDSKISEDSSLYTDILFVLGHWENMALAIHSNVADEDVAFEMVAGMTISSVRVFRNFIERRREVNVRAYDYLLRLSDKWSERLVGLKRPIFSDLAKVSLTSR